MEFIRVRDKQARKWYTRSKLINNLLDKSKFKMIEVKQRNIYTDVSVMFSYLNETDKNNFVYYFYLPVDKDFDGFCKMMILQNDKVMFDRMFTNIQQFAASFSYKIMNK